MLPHGTMCYVLTTTEQWRNDIIRYFQHGHGERIPVMMLGLKRDLRKEGEGIIYPQEVCGSYVNQHIVRYIN